MKKLYFYLIACASFLFCFFTFHSTFIRNTLTSGKNPPCIVIDVGHGGSDPGKVSATGIEEKNVNLQIALYLKDYLIARDFQVYLTRETDCGLYDENVSNKKTSDLNNRLQFIQEKHADCMISIHQNSYPDATQHGAQTFYYVGSEKGKQLADSIQNSLLKIDETNKRQIKSSDSYYILKHSSVPAVIVECGFLSNPEESARLMDSNYQKEIANSISMGICDYIESKRTAN